MNQEQIKPPFVDSEVYELLLAKYEEAEDKIAEMERTIFSLDSELFERNKEVADLLTKNNILKDALKSITSAL